MTKKDSTQTTVNAGPMPDRRRDDEVRQFDVTGNVTEKGQDPSPDDRERGEARDKESAAT